ncbi:hypothetical protein LXL04_020154 [Taraxacum kok-saghyz]
MFLTFYQVQGKNSSDEEDLNDVPDDHEYDTKDSFIDDTELNNYFQVDNSQIKHDGFFVNHGKNVSGTTQQAMVRKEGSNTKSKSALLEKAIKDLEKIVVFLIFCQEHISDMKSLTCWSFDDIKYVPQNAKRSRVSVPDLLHGGIGTSRMYQEAFQRRRNSITSQQAFWENSWKAYKSIERRAHKGLETNERSIYGTEGFLAIYLSPKGNPNRIFGIRKTPKMHGHPRQRLGRHVGRLGDQRNIPLKFSAFIVIVQFTQHPWQRLRLQISGAMYIAGKDAGAYKEASQMPRWTPMPQNEPLSRYGDSVTEPLSYYGDSVTFTEPLSHYGDSVAFTEPLSHYGDSVTKPLSHYGDSVTVPITRDIVRISRSYHKDVARARLSSQPKTLGTGIIRIGQANLKNEVFHYSPQKFHTGRVDFALGFTRGVWSML